MSEPGPMITDRGCALCGATLDGLSTCPRCLTDQQMPEAEELRTIDTRLESIEVEERALQAEKARLRGREATLRAVLRSRTTAPLQTTTSTTTTTATSAPAQRMAARPERPAGWRPERIRDLLLWTGGALIVLSALSFGAVVWARDRGTGPPLLTPTRTGFLLLALSALMGLVAWLLRKRLPATAEVLAVLVIVLVLVDWHVFRRGGLGSGVGTAAWWILGCALAGVLSILGGVAGLRALRVLAPVSFSVAAGLCISLAATNWRQAVLAAGVSVAFVVAARAALAVPEWTPAAVACLLAAAGFVATGLVLCIDGIATATRAAEAYGPATAMIALGGAIASAHVLLRDRLAAHPPLADVLIGLTTLAVLAAGVFLAVPGASAPAVLTAIAVAGVLAVAVGRLTQARLGPGVAAAGGVALVVGLAAVVRPLSTAVFAPLSWLGEPWTLDPRVRADLRLVPDGSVVIEGGGWALAVIGLWWLATVLAGSGRRPRPLVPDVLVVVSAFAAVAVICLAPVVAHRAVGAVFAATLGAALVLTALSEVIGRSDARVVVVLGAAAVAAIPSAGWGATNRWLAVGGLCAGFVVFALVAVRTRRPVLRTVALGLAGVCLAAAAATWSLAVGAALTTTGVVLAAVGAVLVVLGAHMPASDMDRAVVSGVGILALAVAGGLAASSPAHVATVLTIAAAALAVASAASWPSGVHAVGIGAATVCLAAAAAAWTLAVGAAVTTTGVVLAAVGAILVVLGAHVPASDADRSVLSGVGILALAVAGGLAASSPAHVATVLTIAAVGLAMASAGSGGPAWTRWLAGVTLLGALLAWLAAAGVTVVEAYSVPVGVAALIAGAVVRRQRHDLSSWVAYGPGLVVLLGSSLVAALERGPLVRVVLLTLAALLTVLTGVRHELRAPIVLGTATLLVLGVDAALPVAPDVPRWIPIGVAGVLLLWLGATFERRMASLRRLRATFRGFD